MQGKQIWNILCAIIMLATCPLAWANDASPWGGSDTEWGALPVDCKWEPCADWPTVYPTMLGDLGGFGGFNFFSAGGIGGGGGIGAFSAGGFNVGGINFGGLAAAPLSVFRGAYKIAENESPVPQDRVFVAYNYYHNVSRIADVHRETPGFEKTFLDGMASIGLRAPVIQVVEDAGGQDYGDFADLTVPLKFALLTTDSGGVLSGGMAITIPTGPNATGFRVENNVVREVHPTLLQPFVGYYLPRNDWFVHGFHSVMTPTDSDDVTAAFNDVAVGYWWRQPSGGLVTAAIPTLEVHVNTPLDHRDPDSLPRYRDAVHLTGGLTLIMAERITLAGGVVTPVTGPKLFDVEAITSLNVFY